MLYKWQINLYRRLTMIYLLSHERKVFCVLDVWGKFSSRKTSYNFATNQHNIPSESNVDSQVVNIYNYRKCFVALLNLLMTQKSIFKYFVACP